MNKNTFSVRKNQEKNKYSQNKHSETFNTLTEWSNSNANVLKVLNALLFYSNCFGPYVDPSHETIAARSGISVRTVKRMINLLREKNMLYTKYRHRHTSVYRLAPLFSNPTFRWSIRLILKAAKWTFRPLKKSIELVKNTVTTILNRFGLPLISKDIYIKNNTKDKRYSLEKGRWFMKIASNHSHTIESIEKTAILTSAIRAKTLLAINENVEEKEFKFLQNAIDNPNNIFARILLNQLYPGVV